MEFPKHQAISSKSGESRVHRLFKKRETEQDVASDRKKGVKRRNRVEKT